MEPHRVFIIRNKAGKEVSKEVARTSWEALSRYRYRTGDKGVVKASKPP